MVATVKNYICMVVYDLESDLCLHVAKSKSIEEVQF